MPSILLFFGDKDGISFLDLPGCSSDNGILASQSSSVSFAHVDCDCWGDKEFGDSKGGQSL